MECLGGAWSIVPCLWGCSDKHATYIGDFKDNLASLRSGRDKLKDLREDVNNRVREAEEQHMKRTNRVNGWLERVETVDNEVDEILQRGDQELGNKCLGSCCPKNCWSNYKIGKKVLKMIPRVTEFAEEGEKFDVVANELPPPPVDEQPMDNVVVGFESKFEQVWQSVQNNDSSVIGLVGMGGVGKTTLLKQLNNEFLKATHTYDLVIWVVVSKPANLGKIRSALRSKLNIPDHMWEHKSEDQKNSTIFSKLKKKKFMVLLDDIWEGLELSKLGIPQPSMGNMSKIVFTTRSREVCRSMSADKVIQVGCLPPDQAFNLFYSKLGVDIVKFHPEMRGLITDVASECEGLPLALITIGRAMRGKTDVRQWKEAKEMLRKYPSNFPGMEGVFAKLMFSYDSLPNPTVKKCFEYCSLYPEDHNIIEEEVIKLWVAEGFIGKYHSMYDALIQGRQIIESLKEACLLETVERIILELPKMVSLHDVIRDMALWIACERGEKMNKFCVEVASGDYDDTIVAPNAMTDAEKILLRGAGITMESLEGMSCCPNLSTLIIQDTKVKELPDDIFHSMNVLKVLDLSNNNRLMQLPIHNGCLTNLEYLNIAESMRKGRMPTEVSQWKRLRFLIVDYLLIIPRDIISSLCSLQMFEQLDVSNSLGKAINSERESVEKGMLQELEGLKHIMDIRLVLLSATAVQTLLESPKLQRCTTKLVVKEVKSPMLDFATEALTKHLERLQVYWSEMSEIKLGRPSLCNDLCEVSIAGCRKIRNLSSLIYVPNLCVLEVRHCESMEELIGEEETRGSNVGTSLFSSLTSLTLLYLPKLRSICPQVALPFPSLKFMKVDECKNLVKLPLDSNTANTTPPELIIKGGREWWHALQWDGQATKDAFTPKLTI